MHALSADTMLALWERGHALHPLDRALLILAAAEPEIEPDQLTHLSLGRRDALLLAVRAATFGEQLSAYVRCACCNGELEFDLPCGALRAGDAAPAQDVFEVNTAGYQIRLRALNSVDAAAMAGAPSVAEASERALALAVVQARCGEEDVRASDLPATVRTAVAEALTAADPQADTVLDLSCPECGHAWQSVFDITEFMWTELVARAQHLLYEVHLLAQAYGWSEREILSLSPARRASYLQAVTA